MRRLTLASDTSSTLKIPGIRTLHRREATKVESAMGTEFWVSAVPTLKDATHIVCSLRVLF